MKILPNVIIKLRVWQTKIISLDKKYLEKFILIFAVLLCIILNFLFMHLVLENGFTGDDWRLLFNYKTFAKPLSRILEVWSDKGPYLTTQFYYIGLLDKFFGFNLPLFQIINIFFKIFASITLYFLILRIFKDYFLAYLSAFIFSIIHSSAGALQYVVKGTEYLGIGFMNLFFYYYYIAIVQNSTKLIYISSLFLFIAFLLSPIRLYPLYALVFLVEVYLAIRMKKILLSISRLIILFFPIIFLLMAITGNTSGYLNGTINFIKDILQGNWQYLLLPFKALGYTLLGNDQLQFLHLTAEYVGIGIFISSIICFYDWVKKGSQLNKAFLLFSGLWFAFFFLISTWIILGNSFNLGSTVHWYLIVPSLGISLFISSLICLLLDKGVGLRRYLYKLIALVLFITVVFICHYEITQHYSYFLSIGTGSKDQLYLQNQVLSSINNQNHPNLIIYLEIADQINSQFYNVALNTGYIREWLLYFKTPQFLGCIALITDKNKLREVYKVDKGGYFETNGLCAETRYNIGIIKTVYDVKDFRAFLLKDKKISDITNQVLLKLKSI